jgi:hypothetical protein
MKDGVDVPNIESIMAYKGIYALCTVTMKELKVTHWAAVLIAGSHPVWGVWTVKGKFLRFYSFRSQIEEDYPRLVWRRKMGTWTCVSFDDKSIPARRSELEKKYGKAVPAPEDRQ